MSVRSAVRTTGVAAAALGTWAMTVGPARADDPCDQLNGAARQYCQQDGGKGGGSGGGGTADPANPLDPLQMLAKSCAKAASYAVHQLSAVVKDDGSVDFTNGAFLRMYALVFAASTFLVLLLWLWAIVKRAVRGVPMTQALGEAIGLLWLAVMASAFTPLILYVVTGAVDGITAGILAGGSGHADFFNAFSEALEENADSGGGGGAVMQIALSLITVLMAFAVWLEMLIRTALLFVGGVLACIVYAGLVDKALWPRVRVYVGMLGAIILIKPVVVIVLRLASVVSGGVNKAPVSAIVSGLSILVIAILVSLLLYKLIPGMGDEVRAAQTERRNTSDQKPVAIAPAEMTVRQGIVTHSARDGARTPMPSQTTTSAGGGIAAHASRESSHSTRSGPARPTRTSEEIFRRQDGGENLY